MQHRSELPGPPNRAGNLTLDGDREAFSRPAIDNVGANIIWTSADGDTVVTLWGKNLGDEWDWKNIGPPIGFHYAVPGGMGPGEAGRGFSGRKQVGLDARFDKEPRPLMRRLSSTATHYPYLYSASRLLGLRPRWAV